MSRHAYWQNYLNNSSGLNERHTVIIVFLHASRNGEYVWIKDDVVGTEADRVDKDVIRPCADLHFPLHVRCLATT